MASLWFPLILGMIIVTTCMPMTGNTEVPKKEKYYLKPGEHCMENYYKTKEHVTLKEAVDVCKPCPDGYENKNPETVLTCKETEIIALSTTTATNPPAKSGNIVTPTAPMDTTTEKKTTKPLEILHTIAETTTRTTNTSTGSIPATDQPKDENEVKNISDEKDQCERSLPPEAYVGIAMGVLVIIVGSFAIGYCCAKSKYNKTNKTKNSSQEGEPMMESNSSV